VIGNASAWLRDWGTLGLAAVAAMGSIWSLIANLVHHRRHWQRAHRVPAYVRLAGAASDLVYVYADVRMKTPTERAAIAREPMQRLDAALAEAAIVGPSSVTSAARVFGDALKEYGGICAAMKPGDSDPSEYYVEEALGAFVDAAAAAIGYRHERSAMSLEEFKRSLPQPTS
jgi:hypothetical protein